MAIAGYGNILITMSLKGDCKLGELLRNPAYDGFRMPAEFEQHHGCITVSYTHLTLPTKRIVEISVVAVSLKKKKVLHKEVMA